MTYNIFSNTAPAMPKPAKGTEFCKLLLSQASKDMREPLVPMSIPALAAHLTGVEFMYCDNQYYELCGQMGHLIGASGVGKAQLIHLIETIMRPFRDHDETEYKRLSDWIRLTKTKGANKEKPERPDVSFWFPPADLTNPAFIQNAMALEKSGGRTQYLNLPEVEMAARRTPLPPAATSPAQSRASPAAPRLQGLRRVLYQNPSSMILNTLCYHTKGELTGDRVSSPEDSFGTVPNEFFLRKKLRKYLAVSDIFCIFAI